MSTLATDDRLEIFKNFMSVASRTNEIFGAMTKADLLSAVNALDDWIDSNAAAINQALPETARSELTTSQKARLLAYVVLKRYNAGV